MREKWEVLVNAFYATWFVLIANYVLSRFSIYSFVVV